MTRSEQASIGCKIRRERDARQAGSQSWEPQGRCFVVTMIYPSDEGLLSVEERFITGRRTLATRRIFRKREEAEHYATGLAKCFQAKTHQVKAVEVVD